jgi:heparinase II/III-like protein
MTYFSRFSWYARRLGRMSPGEVAWRAREQALRSLWARRQVLPGDAAPGTVPGLAAGERRFTAVLPPGTRGAVPESARSALIADADRILKGEWEMLGVVRADMDQPDWFYDPATGRRSGPSQYAFRINQRSEEQVGNIKQVWEANRLQHLTLLATAWYLTGEDAYAERVDTQLRDWFAANPFLSGVNWTSGIELGVRLINFTWIRRLLSDWPGVAALFEDNDLALRQIRWHQEYLATFVSRGSSANNHVIAEAAGQLAASCAFPWFADSERWRRSAASLLGRSLAANTFPSGINRELATDYHGFVFELGAYAAAEAAASGHPVDSDTWGLLCSMADCMAALVDEKVRPPRQGDSDEGRVVLLDAPEHNRWPELLSIGSALFRPLAWWPGTEPGAASVLVSALAGVQRQVPGRPGQRPSRFTDAGITLLRTDPHEHGAAPEIWVRCDGGPHGFLSIAAHAHADALSVEVRHGGVDILADPGTYCYHGEPEWRSYFRSTIAHNTLEIGGRSQSAEGGPFMWLRHARVREITVGIPDPEIAWAAEHDGYARLGHGASHRRTVRFERAARCLEITDVAEGSGHEVRLAFHLGPRVTASLSGTTADLAWLADPGPGTADPGKADRTAARLELPDGLTWTLHKGETTPILGWYSPSLGQKEPAATLLGVGGCRRGMPLVTRLTFLDSTGASAEEP